MIGRTRPGREGSLASATLVQRAAERSDHDGDAARDGREVCGERAVLIGALIEVEIADDVAIDGIARQDHLTDRDAADRHGEALPDREAEIGRGFERGVEFAPAAAIFKPRVHAEIPGAAGAANEPEVG